MGSAFFADGGEEFALVADVVVDGERRAIGDGERVAGMRFRLASGGLGSGFGGGLLRGEIGMDGGEQRGGDCAEGFVAGRFVAALIGDEMLGAHLAANALEGAEIGADFLRAAMRNASGDEQHFELVGGFRNSRGGNGRMLREPREEGVERGLRSGRGRRGRFGGGRLLLGLKLVIPAVGAAGAGDDVATASLRATVIAAVEVSVGLAHGWFLSSGGVVAR